MLDEFFRTLATGVTVDPLMSLLLVYVAGLPAGMLLAALALRRGDRLGRRDALLAALAPLPGLRSAVARRSRGRGRPALNCYRMYGAIR